MANNLSTLLLIGVLLFLIYCLMKQPTQSKGNAKVSKDKFTDSNQDEDDSEYGSDSDVHENFENEDDNESNYHQDDNESNYHQDDNESNYYQDDDEKESFKNESGVVGISESNLAGQATGNDNMGVPDISPEMINQLVNETERKSVPLSSPLLQQTQSNQIHQFEPNDTQSHSGASLDNAFERPVADNTNTDVVDLKKNNVKNYNAKDYLPKEINDDWFNTDFSQAKYKMNDDKLINTDKYIIGINTVGQSLKNASYDIRGSVNVPKYTVSPWNNSTIEPDFNLKPLC